MFESPFTYNDEKSDLWFYGFEIFFDFYFFAMNNIA